MVADKWAVAAGWLCQQLTLALHDGHRLDRLSSETVSHETETDSFFFNHNFYIFEF